MSRHLPAIGQPPANSPVTSADKTAAKTAGLTKEASASTVLTERTTVSSEDAPLSHSTSLTSLEDSTAEDAVHALIAPARYRAHKSQQIEDSERTRASTPREGMDWFDRFGGNRVVPAHLPNATYPVNYEGHATNWSMVHHLMFTQMFEHPTFTFSPKRAQQSKKPLPPIPKHVLDIGCDIMASFIVEMLQFPGWENTHFTGLDLAPVLFPQDRLPAEMKQRVRFVQADIFKRWPFEDATFDFVRMANLEHVVPEDVWQHALEEARRVAGGGLIEVSAGSMASESQINALSRTGDSPGIMEEVRMRDEAHLTAAMKAAHDRAGLTIWPLSMIPFNLIMTSKMVDKTGEISMSTNWHLRDDDDVESFHDSVKSISSANSSGQKWAAALDEQACRSALAAHTGIHCGLIERQYEDWKYYNPRSNISWKDHVGIFDAFHMQRTRQAGLGRMIGTAWNWHCESDLQTERALQKNLETLKDELAAAKARQLQNLQDMDMPIKPTSVAEVERTIRDAETELRSCRVRLGKEAAATNLTFEEPFNLILGAFIGGPT